MKRAKRSRRKAASRGAARGKRKTRDPRAAQIAPPDPIEETLKAEHMLDSVLFRERQGPGAR